MLDTGASVVSLAVVGSFLQEKRTKHRMLAKKYIFLLMECKLNGKGKLSFLN
jgi:hypothetical protein